MFDLISNGGVFCNGNLSSYKGDPFTNRREPTWLDPISGYPLGVTPLEVTPLGVNPLGMTDIEHENLEIPLPLTLFLPGSKTPYSYRGVWGGGKIMSPDISGARLPKLIQFSQIFSKCSHWVSCLDYNWLWACACTQANTAHKIVHVPLPPLKFSQESVILKQLP